MGYDFYVAVYQGDAIPADQWPVLAQRAGEQLRQYKRLYTVAAPTEDAESMAICAMAEALYNAQLVANGQAVQSASIGSVSTSYATAAAQAVDVSPAGLEQALYRAACRYVDIYRGVGGC